MRRDSGFTLVETLVAFAILALVFVLVVPMFRDTMEKTDQAALTRAATSLAESKLAELTRDAELRRGEQTGTEGRFRWALQMRPTADLPTDNPLRLAVYDVTASVAWTEAGRERLLSLHTLRLGPQP